MPESFMATPPSDEDLAGRACEGCAASFEELVRRYQVPLLHFLGSRARSDEAEDLLQETFLNAFKNLHQYRAKWKFSTWLFTIARNLSVNARRKRRPVADSAMVESAAASHDGPHRSLVDAEARRDFWRTVADVLSEVQHTALWLHYVEAMPMEQIAVILGRSTSAIKTLVHRARRKLMPVLEATQPDARAERSLGPDDASRRNGMNA